MEVTNNVLLISDSSYYKTFNLGATYGLILRINETQIGINQSDFSDVRFTSRDPSDTTVTELLSVKDCTEYLKDHFYII